MEKSKDEAFEKWWKNGGWLPEMELSDESFISKTACHALWKDAFLAGRADTVARLKEINKCLALTVTHIRVASDKATARDLIDLASKGLEEAARIESDDAKDAPCPRCNGEKKIVVIRQKFDDGEPPIDFMKTCPECCGTGAKAT